MTLISQIHDQELTKNPSQYFLVYQSPFNQ